MIVNSFNCIISEKVLQSHMIDIFEFSSQRRVYTPCVMWARHDNLESVVSPREFPHFSIVVVSFSLTTDFFYHVIHINGPCGTSFSTTDSSERTFFNFVNRFLEEVRL